MGPCTWRCLARKGWRNLRRNAGACSATKNAVLALEGVEAVHPDGVHFNEFVIRLEKPAQIYSTSWITNVTSQVALICLNGGLSGKMKF